jgi:predicted transcriptional regulator YheO
MPPSDAISSVPQALTSGSSQPIDAYFGLLQPLVAALSQTFGHSCEVVLHDFRTPDASIVAIAGNVTGRHVGGSMSQIGLSILAAGDEANDLYNYVTRAPSGRELKSTTLVLRDSNHSPFGLLCINLDITDLRKATEALQHLIGLENTSMASVAFTDDIDQLIDAVLDEEDVNVVHSLDKLTKPERLALLGALDKRGTFALQRSVPRVAGRLGVSRTTLYSDLQELRRLSIART